MKTIVKNNATINQQINRIFRILSIQASDDTVVIQEKARKGSSCNGIISILSRDDKDRQDADKSYVATPIVRYAFYPNLYFPSRLGSVAVYCKDVSEFCSQLMSQCTFFSVEIIDANVEFGKRPFVDVRLLA